MTSVSYSVRDGVALVIVDRPPVNAADGGVRAGIRDGVARAQTDAAAKAILIACAGRTFISGADIGEFVTGLQPPNFNDVLAIVEGSAKPVVASLHGTALGGGFETALACHYRVAVPAAKMGLPEITLGIIPGAGGTQRLPRLIGAKAALDMMLKGAPIGAQDALKLGLIDAIVDGDPIEAGLAYAKDLVAKGAPVRRTRDRTTDATGFDDAGIKEIMAANAKGLKGRTTQNDLLTAVKASLKPFDEGLGVEQKIADVIITSPEARALIHVFFAEREAAKIPGLPENVEGMPIRKAAVVGAGTMGGGIAMALADSGVPVVLIEAKQEFLDRGLNTIRGNYDVSVKRGRFTEKEVEAKMGLISPTLDTSAASDVDVVIEAVFENMELKKSVLAGLDKVLPKHAVLASNTSSLSLTELASVTSRQDKVVGLHFFSPANVMRLLEIVRGEKTSQETLATAQAVAKKLRKVGVVAGDGFGFIGNRMMLDGQWRENEMMLLEGVAPERLDAAIESFGFAMGPNKVNDMGGVDIGTKVRIELLKREKRPAPYHVVSDALTPTGNLGQKTGQGVYRYEKGDRTPRPNPDFAPFVAKLAEDYGVTQREVSDAEIVERMVLSLINIGAQILEDGVAYRASDIDVVWTSGYGFPRWRGGPMFYADELGLPNVLAKIRGYEKRYGAAYWKPSPLLVKLAESGSSFAARDKSIAS